LKIFFSATSPYARKCVVAAHELGLRDRIELMPGNASPVNRDRTIVSHNPLGKVPTFLTDDGTVLFDSRVIVEYLDSLGGGALIPREGPARWNVLVEQALADGILDAALLTRYETVLRPQELRWTQWIDGQIDKVKSGLDEIEKHAGNFAERVDIGTIACACALSYLDLRFPTLAWRDGHPRSAAWLETFGARESMVATQPPR
jgi:glutathione S-transferase